MLDLFKDKLYNSFLKKFINLLAIIKIKPNHLTSIGLITGLIAAYTIYKHHFIWAIIFILISTLCDLCDGWLARTTKQVSKFGKIYDVTMDKYVEGLLGLALAFVVPSFILKGYVWVIIGLFGSILISVVSNSGAQVTNKKPFKLMARSDRGILLVLGLVAAVLFGNIFLTYTVILLALLSHLTVITMLISYRNILKKN